MCESHDFSIASPKTLPRRLHDYLGSQLIPLVTLLFVVTTVSAPFAFYVLGRRALRARAYASAHQVVALLEREAELRPDLWKYDSVKLLEHIRAYEVLDGIRVDVVDARGLRIDSKHTIDPSAQSSNWVWARVPLQLGTQEIGAVWVGASQAGLIRNALMLLLGFGALGGILAWLMYHLPMRAVQTAEQELSQVLSRLEASQSELATLNENLELQVEARNSELARAYRDLRELSARAVALQESERRGIARELHDSAGQSLTAIRIHLELMVVRLKTTADTALLESAEQLASLVDDAVEEIRRAVNQLGPAILDDVGLETAVQRTIDDFTETTGIHVERDFQIATGLDASLEITCYRFVQEALTNVTRHADATWVRVRMLSAQDDIRVEVQDNGRGLDRSSISPRSRGLQGMLERMKLVGGSLTIDSIPGQGTTLRGFISRPSSQPEATNDQTTDDAIG